jgi:plasmid stabilization system protein ParE
MARRLRLYAVELRPGVIDDLQAIGDYIAACGYPERAGAYVQKLTDASLALSHLPTAYPRVPGAEEWRQRIVGSHRIIFRVEAQRVVVTRILHIAHQVDPDADEFEAP